MTPLEQKKADAKRLMTKTPGPAMLLWRMLHGNELPTQEADDLYLNIKALELNQKKRPRRIGK